MNTRQIAIYLAAVCSLSALPALAQDRTAAPTRLAIVMGGAVSLGAFEGGVVHEMVRLLEDHNAANDEQFEIDILVGASAGSMTLAMLAHQLYNNPKTEIETEPAKEESRTGGLENNTPPIPVEHASSDFYQAWVERIDIRKLLLGKEEWAERDHSERNLESSPFIFSTSEIEQIAVEMIKNCATGERSSIAPDKLVLAMTLANMDGLEYRIPYKGGLHEYTRLHMEHRIFRIDVTGKKPIIELMDAAGNTAKQSDWVQLRNTAIASGAYPLAFIPKILTRYKGEFGNELPLRFDQTNTDSSAFNYADGGTFNNEPLHLATQIAAWKDADTPGVKRQYIILTPEISTAVPDLSGHLNPESAKEEKYLGSFVDYLKQLSGMILKTSNSFDKQSYIAELKARRKKIADVIKSVRDLQEAGDDNLKTALRGAEFLKEKGALTSDTRIMLSVGSLAPSNINYYLKQFSKTLRNFSYTSEDRSLIEAGLNSKIDSLLTSTYYSDKDANDEFSKQANWLKSTQASTLAKNLGLLLLDELGLARGIDFTVISSTVGDEVIPLMGTSLNNFGGFFNKKFRHHDFVVGQYATQQILSKKEFAVTPSPVRKEHVQKMKQVETKFAAEWTEGKRKDQIPFTKHFDSDDDRKWFRDRVDERVDAYAYGIFDSVNFVRPVIAHAVHKIADRRFDKMVYNTPDKPHLATFLNLNGLGRSAALSYTTPSGISWPVIGSVYLDGLLSFSSELGNTHLDVGLKTDHGFGSSNSTIRYSFEAGGKFGLNTPAERLAIADELRGQPIAPYAGINLRLFVIKVDVQYLLKSSDMRLRKDGNYEKVNPGDRLGIDIGLEIAHANSIWGMGAGLGGWIVDLYEWGKKKMPGNNNNKAQ